MAKRRAKDVVERSVVVRLSTENDLRSGKRLLRRRVPSAIIRVGPVMNDRLDPANVVRVQGVAQLRAWLESARRPAMRTTFFLVLEADFAVYQQTTAALASMRVQLPTLLASGQDQVFVLDREQRMVAFLGHWPKESPRQPQDLLGKRKRDVFGADVAAMHEAAGLRALNGEEAAYEWAVTDTPVPVYLFTAASPLRNDDGEIAGVLLVTRDVTRLKRAQLEMEKALQEKTNQLLEVERGVRQVAAAFQPAVGGHLQHTNTNGLHASGFLSTREQQVLTLLRRGVRLRSIAQTLGISVETVRRHVKAMFRKTGVHSQEALVKLFIGSGDHV